MIEDLLAAVAADATLPFVISTSCSAALRVSSSTMAATAAGSLCALASSILTNPLPVVATKMDPLLFHANSLTSSTCGVALIVPKILPGFARTSMRERTSSRLPTARR